MHDYRTIVPASLISLMDLLNIKEYKLRGLARNNVLLGKNGCGKSRVLKICEEAVRGRPDIGTVKYLSPERGGLLRYEANVEHNIATNVEWMPTTRRQNQASQFREQSAVQFRRLELLTLREIEQNPVLRANPSVTFQVIVDRINSLLDRVYIERTAENFTIRDKVAKEAVDPLSLSSGESELISLGIECLAFEKECDSKKTNLLLIDEPDVHLHPDLQARLAQFIKNLASGIYQNVGCADLGPSVSKPEISVVIATHSTAFLGALSDDEETRLAFMRYGDTDITFTATTDTHRKILPVFGAHPLSNVFNQAPVLLIEGEDDERIWQQAVRTSKGRIRIYPCAVDGITQLKSFEQEVAKILQAVYDNAIGFSLRDRDADPEEISSVGPITRMRLHCRTAENLLISDEVLSKLQVPWEELKARIEIWLQSNECHPHHGAMRAFADTGYDRKNADLKEIRNDLMGLMGSNKPWEVLVGQVIAEITALSSNPSATSLAVFLGISACQQLLKLPLISL